MLFPFIVGLIGLNEHMKAEDIQEEADDIVKDAKRVYNNAKRSLARSKKRAENSLAVFSQSRDTVIRGTLKDFLDAYAHVVVVEVKINDLNRKMTIDKKRLTQLQGMVSEYDALMPDKGAVNISGTEAALYAGVAFSLVPMLLPAASLFSGISARSDAEDYKEDASVFYAEARAAAAKMRVQNTLCKAIANRADLFNDLLNKLNALFAEFVEKVRIMVDKKLKDSGCDMISEEQLSEEEGELLYMADGLCAAICSILHAQILTKGGRLSKAGNALCNKAINEAYDRIYRGDYEKVNIV